MIGRAGWLVQSRSRPSPADFNQCLLLCDWFLADHGEGLAACLHRPVQPSGVSVIGCDFGNQLQAVRLDVFPNIARQLAGWGYDQALPFNLRAEALLLELINGGHF